MGFAGQPAAAEQHEEFAHALRRAHRDDGRGRCARHPHRAVHHGQPGAGAQARHLPPHLQPGPACGAARIRARQGRWPHGHLGPGTGGHRAPGHRAAGRQHRGADDQQLAPPVVRRALSAVGARGQEDRFRGPVAPVVAGHHGAGRHCQRQTHLPGRHRRWQPQRLCARRRHPRRLRRQLQRGLHRPGEPLFPVGPRHQIWRAVHRPHLRGRGPV